MLISPETTFDQAEIRELYSSVGWNDWANDVPRVLRALTNSHVVITARDESGALLGLARTVSDDELICYVQELLVDVKHQGKGVGGHLLEHLKERYAHCRHFVLTTDHESTPDGKLSHAFYRKHGMIEHQEQSLSAFGLRR